MKVKLDPGAYEPTRAHLEDAGLDIRAKNPGIVRANNSAVFNTGVHIQLPHWCCGLLVSKSGLNTNHDITSTGLIDAGYTGEIKVKLYNHGSDDYFVRAGDKITQLVVLPFEHPYVEIVDELEETGERGSKGFGSSGR